MPNIYLKTKKPEGSRKLARSPNKRTESKQRKKQIPNNRNRTTSYTALPCSLLLISLSTPWPSGGPSAPLLPFRLSFEDVEALLCLCGRIKLKTSFKVLGRQSFPLLPRPSRSLPSPLGSGTTPVKLRSRSFQRWALLKTLKPVPASEVTHTPQDTRTIIIASAMPTEIFTHACRLDMNISILKAVVNVIMLSTNDVRSTIPEKTSNLWRLTTKEAVNRAD